jgi:SAM-dependent methyltransferase
MPEIVPKTHVRRRSHASREVPHYAANLTRAHRLHRRELRRIVADLPIPRGGNVLDLGSGDGSWLRWLAAEVGAQGSATGVDLSRGLLRLSRRSLRRLRPRGAVRFIAGRAETLPFRDGSFDLAWCAQSLISLPDLEAALSEMARVVRPGGYVSVLEDDALHEVLLGWPPDLELAIRTAQWNLLGGNGKRSRHYVGRRLDGLLRRAGLQPRGRRTYAIDRRTPLEDVERDFVLEELRALDTSLGNALPRGARSELKRLCDSTYPHPLIDVEGGFVTFLHFVASARKRH